MEVHAAIPAPTAPHAPSPTTPSARMASPAQFESVQLAPTQAAPTPQTHSVAPTAPAADPPAASTPDEEHLTNEIGQLWKAHSQAQGSLRKSREEAKEIRADLSKRLHELKAVLSRPGRGGAWSSFLGSQNIPRSTADTLIRGYKKTIATESQNLPSEQITEPTEVTARRYCHAIWPKLSQRLTTMGSIEIFIEELRQTAEKSFGGVDEPSSNPGPDVAAPSA